MEILKRCFCAILILIYASGPMAAHEFWMEGAVSSVDGLSVIDLDLNVGQKMVGQSLPFIPDHVVGFRHLDGERDPIVGQIGDIPAARLAFDQKEGFAAFIEMAPRIVQHSDWNAFLQYLDMEGLQGIETEHLARGLPLSGFNESYARHAKLVVLGTGKDFLIPEHHSNAPIEIELIAIQENSEHNLLVRGRLSVDGAQEQNRQVTVFERMDGGVKSYPVLTDKGGEFRTTSPKGATLLFNSVMMTNGGRYGSAWHSDWASLLVVDVTK